MSDSGSLSPPDFSDDFEGGRYSMIKDGTISPNGKWRNYYGGYGQKGVTAETLFHGAKNNYFFQNPKIATSPRESHASMTLTSTQFTDFDMTFRQKVVKQLRQNGPPNTWETIWFFWHFTDNWHNYAAVLKTNGLQIEKKDNDTQSDAEIFLLDNHAFTVKMNTWQTIRLRVIHSISNKPRFQVWIDGVQAADYTDSSIHQPNSAALQNGYVGFYCEDSLVNLDDVYITTL
jgi:3-keto-disaccharide hydrolase